MGRDNIKIIKDELNTYFKSNIKNCEIKSRLDNIYINIHTLNRLVICISVITSKNKIIICTKHKVQLIGDKYTREKIHNSDREYNNININTNEILGCYFNYTETIFNQVYNNSNKGRYYV